MGHHGTTIELLDGLRNDVRYVDVLDGSASAERQPVLVSPNQKDLRDLFTSLAAVREDNT